MTDLINTPLDELASRVKLIERAALAIRVIADAGPVTLPDTTNVTNVTAEKQEEKAAPKKRAPRKKKAAPKPEPEPEVEEEEEEDLIGGEDEEESEEPEITQQDVIDLARKVVAAKKQDVLKKLTTKLKIDKIRNAKTEDYPTIITTLQAALD